MSTARLTIDLGALADNWRALDAKTSVETAAVVKADGYGLDAGRVSRALADADPMHQSGARSYVMRRWMINEGSLTLQVGLSTGSNSLS